MKTKHTQGPWEVVCIEGLSDWAFLGVGSEASTKAICHIHFEATIENGVVKIPDECKTNAKLIAAAPELLEALQEYVWMQEGCISKVSTTPSERLEKAKQAIKKSTE